jgi:hypothetical protein
MNLQMIAEKALKLLCIDCVPPSAVAGGAFAWAIGGKLYDKDTPKSSLAAAAFSIKNRN